MSDSRKARRADTRIVFAGTDITVFVNKSWMSLTYTDNEEDQADDLQLTVSDRDGNWLKKWLRKITESAANSGVIIDTPPEDDSSSGSSGSSTSGSKSGGTVNTSTKRYKVTASNGVNLRTSASEKASVIAKLPYGTIVDVYSFLGQWAKVSFNGKSGYCKGQNLKFLGKSASSNSTQKKAAKSQSSSGDSDDSLTPSGPIGLKISAVISMCNSDGDGKDTILDCGQFELDSIEASGPPATVNIKGTSLPYDGSVRQVQKCKSWENYTLKGIASEIAESNNMGLMFESAADPSYKRVEQYRSSDIKFLSELCHRAGCSLKATNNILVIFDQEKYEQKNAVRKIKYGSSGKYINYRLSTGESLNYSSCRVFCTKSDGTVISATEYSEDYSEQKGQCLEIRQNVSSVSEAQALAHKYLRLHNKYEYTAVFTMPGDPKLAAGNAVQLINFGAWSGNYIISQAQHTVSSSGYTTRITLRKALKASASSSTVSEASSAAKDSDDDIQQLALAVIRGEWGAGQERYDRLTAAGHDYNTIQARVNKILYG